MKMFDLQAFAALLLYIIMGTSAGNGASAERKDVPMLDFYVESVAKQERLRNGPFREVMEPLAIWLREQGYAKLTGARWFKDICQFNRWFDASGYRGKPVNERHVCQYLEECSGRKGNPYAPTAGKNGKRTLFPQLFALLGERQRPKAAQATTVPATPIEDFERHLTDWYGASPSTIHRHRKHAQEFHAFAFGEAKPNWGKIEPVVVLDFIRQRVESNPRPRDIIGCLRCYFRYLHIRGHEMTRLLDALPRLYRPRRPLPERLLSAEQVKRWLAGFDRVGADGLRNYAMALCLADLGVRAGDVTSLRMDDIDWHNGTIRIPNSKTGRSFWLPLPSRTGKAIARYLRHGRPKSVRREVFVRHKTPLNKPLTSVMIDRRMRQVAIKQGIPWFGTYALRHTAATRMRAGGTSLKEIADVLGHVNLSSTAIYAKIDIQELAKVAMPWPEVQP